MISATLLCLALNTYYEARGEPVRGQYAVALVTINRANTQNKPICSVVTKSKQFSWTTDALEPVKSDNKLIGYRLKRGHAPTDMQAWNDAVWVARHTLGGGMRDFTMGANHYHSKAVNPYWAVTGKKTTTIGNHIFYRLT